MRASRDLNERDDPTLQQVLAASRADAPFAVDEDDEELQAAIQASMMTESSTLAACSGPAQ